MYNYNITVSTETEKYNIIELIHTVGAILTAVSGYGSGYYIQLNATPEQVHTINSRLLVDR